MPSVSDTSRPVRAWLVSLSDPLVDFDLFEWLTVFVRTVHGLLLRFAICADDLVPHYHLLPVSQGRYIPIARTH
jgi:hypothetical protein